MYKITIPVELTNVQNLNIIRAGIRAVATPDSAVELPLTAENVESVLDEIRPYLIADGGNVALHEIDGNVVKLKLQGACGSCPSSVTTMKLGIERRLMEKIPEVVAVESIPDEETGLELNEENIEKVHISVNCRTFKIITFSSSISLICVPCRKLNFDLLENKIWCFWPKSISRKWKFTFMYLDQFLYYVQVLMA